MLSPDEKKRFEVSMTINRIVWALMFASVLVYAALAHIAEEQLHGIASLGDDLSILVYALMAVSVITAWQLRFIRGLILAVPFKTLQFAGSPGNAAQGNTTVERRYATSLIVSLALAESVAIYGLLLFIMGASFEIFYLFVGGSALLMLLHRPRMSELEDLAEAVKQHERTAGGR